MLELTNATHRDFSRPGLIAAYRLRY